jgi:hypothetical protein
LLRKPNVGLTFIAEAFDDLPGTIRHRHFDGISEVVELDQAEIYMSDLPPPCTNLLTGAMIENWATLRLNFELIPGPEVRDRLVTMLHRGQFLVWVKKGAMAGPEPPT